MELNTTDYKKLKDEVETKISLKSAKIADAEECKAAAEKDLEAAQAAMKEAVSKGDEDAYQTAFFAKKKAENAIEMNTCRLGTLDVPITDQEYKELRDGIIAAVIAADTEAREILAQHVRECSDVAQAILTVTHDANRVLGRLQDELYNNQDRHQWPGSTAKEFIGEPLHVPVDKLRTAYWARECYEGYGAHGYEKDYGGDLTPEIEKNPHARNYWGA